MGACCTPFFTTHGTDVNIGSPLPSTHTSLTRVAFWENQTVHPAYSINEILPTKLKNLLKENRLPWYLPGHFGGLPTSYTHCHWCGYLIFYLTIPIILDGGCCMPQNFNPTLKFCWCSIVYSLRCVRFNWRCWLRTSANRWMAEHGVYLQLRPVAMAIVVIRRFGQNERVAETSSSLVTGCWKNLSAWLTVRAIGALFKRIWMIRVQKVRFSGPPCSARFCATSFKDTPIVVGNLLWTSPNYCAKTND